MILGFGWRYDPGPCPVDDTPHTACTPESVGALTVHVRRSAAMVRAAEFVAEQLAPPPAPVTFTQKTYRRAQHGKKPRGPRAGD